MGGGGGFLGDIVDFAEDAFDAAIDITTDSLDILSGGLLHDTWEHMDYVLTGDQNRDKLTLESMSNDLARFQSQIEQYGKILDHKFFLEWVFKTHDQFVLKSMGSQYESMYQQYQNKLAEFNERSKGGGIPVIHDVIDFATNIVGALVYSLQNYIKTGDSKYLREFIQVAIAVAATVWAVLNFWNASGWAAIAYATAAIAGIIALDSMVNNSGILASAFEILDFAITEVMQLDKLDSRANAFDKDSKYYQQTMQVVKLTAQVAGLVASAYFIYTAFLSGAGNTGSATGATGRQAFRNANFSDYMVSSGGTQGVGVYADSAGQGINTSQAMSQAGSMSMEDMIIGKINKHLPITKDMPLKELYKGAQMAMNVNDMVSAQKYTEALKEKANTYMDYLERKSRKDMLKKMMSSYLDAEYLMNQLDMAYHSYVLDISEKGQTDYFDPEGTIVMNSRYRPQRSYNFGFEDLFQYENMAGGSMHIYQTLWGV